MSVAEKKSSPAKPVKVTPATSKGPTPARKANSLFRRWHGTLTQELVQHPGDFGLGNVPAKYAPNDTTRATCGFCSTGCSLDIHLKDGIPAR